MTNKPMPKSKLRRKKGNKKGVFRFLNLFRARVHEVSAEMTEEDEWESQAPNTNLWRAFLVLLMVHIIAIGGVLAYDAFRKKETRAEGSLMLDAIADETPTKRTPAKTKTRRPGEHGLMVDNPAFEYLRKHRVRSGENLGDIARRFEVSEEELMEFNQLGKRNPFDVGKILIIPPRELKPDDPPELKELVRSSRKRELPGAPTPAGDGALPGSADKPAKALPLKGGDVKEAPMIATRDEGIADPDKPAGVAIAGSPARSTRKGVLEDSGIIHEVRKGENPYAIARAYGVNYRDLLELNAVEDPTRLKVGRRLHVPKKH